MPTAFLSRSARPWFSGVCLLALAATARGEEAKLRAGDYVAICGDSITEQKMYSADMETYFLVCQPQPKIQATQFGWGGETATGLLGRVENDVLSFQPSVATLNYGMNDGGYIATDANKLNKYKADLDAVVKKMKAAGVRDIVVGTPGAVDSTTFKSFFGTPPDVYNKTLADFGAGAKEIAEKEGVGFADLHGLMIDVMAKAKEKYGRDYVLAGKDGIHPNQNGHLVMAYAYLKALGCDGDVGTLTYDLASGSAAATPGHRIVETSDGSLTVESTRYPFCFTGDPAKPEATTGVTEFFPFNADLNRFLLVVKHAKAGGKVRVTFGPASKEFDAAAAEKGINLAAEFVDNPFSKPFAKVHAAVEAQQKYETPMMKEMLHNLPEWKKAAASGGQEGAFAELEKSMREADAALRTSAAKAVQPVRYTVKVEAVE